MIPDIETENLLLSAPEEARYPDFVRIWQEPHVARFTGGSPRPEPVCRSNWEDNLKGWASMGHGNWVIVEKSSDRTLGQVGFFRKGRGVGADFDDHVEGGWALTETASGKGYGREMLSAAHDWWDRHFPGQQLVCMIDLDNLASHKLALRFGYVPMRDAVLAGGTATLYARLGPRAC